MSVGVGVSVGVNTRKTKKPSAFPQKALLEIWQRPTLSGLSLIPLALRGLTSLFGMGRGGPFRYSHQKNFRHIEENFSI